MPEEARRQLEMNAIKRMTEREAQGDTAYYVKSENGLDSILMRLPKSASEVEKKRMEEMMKRMLKKD